jgi:hypothetical protein
MNQLEFITAQSMGTILQQLGRKKRKRRGKQNLVSVISTKRKYSSDIYNAPPWAGQAMLPVDVWSSDIYSMIG